MNNFSLHNLIRENIKALKPYSSARDEYKDATSAEMIFLDANENPFENGVNRYPDPQQNNVKALLSEIKGIGKEKILLGNGSDEVLDLIFRAFCEPRISSKTGQRSLNKNTHVRPLIISHSISSNV